MLPRMVEKNPMPRKSVPRFARRKLGIRISAGSTIGRGCERQRRAVMTSRTSAAIAAPTTRAPVQPQSRPSTIASASSPSPAIASADPARSGSPVASSSTLSTIARRPIAYTSTPSGRFTRKTQRQSANSASRPPSGGPDAAASAAAAPHVPTAAARRPTGYSGRISASETGTVTAAPAPCTTRAATSASQLGATAHAADAATNSAIPPRKTRLRPRRSARPPAGTSNAAMTMK